MDMQDTETKCHQIKDSELNGFTISFKDKTYNVVTGDSIAGGVIESISNTEVIFKKNNKLYTYDLGINNNIE